MCTNIVYLMCYVRSIYSLFPPSPVCTEIVVAVLLLFFSSSPSCFLLNAKFLQGSCTCRFSENTPSDTMCFCLRSALHPHSCVRLPPFGELNPTVTVRNVSCAEMRRVHLKTAGTTTRSAADGLAGLGAAVTQVFQKVSSTSSTSPSLSPALVDTWFPLRYCLPKQ